MTIESETFSERVKKVRSQLNLSQEDLAHAIGVSFATVIRDTLIDCAGECLPESAIWMWPRTWPCAKYR